MWSVLMRVDCLCQVYEDVTVLTGEHVELLELMYKRGRDVLLKRNIPWLKGGTGTCSVVAHWHDLMAALDFPPCRAKH